LERRPRQISAEPAAAIFTLKNCNAGANIVAAAAGIAGRPGMSRDDLIAINGKIIAEVGAAT
jgi:malate/lactate dehydrogenase